MRRGRIARKAGYSVIFSNSNEDPVQERANLAMLYSQRVGGVVLACSDGHAAYDRLTMRRFPIVFIDRLPVNGFSGRAVVVNNSGAAYKATRHWSIWAIDIAIIAPRLICPMASSGSKVIVKRWRKHGCRFEASISSGATTVWRAAIAAGWSCCVCRSRRRRFFRATTR